MQVGEGSAVVTLTLVGLDWLNLHPGYFAPRQKVSVTQLNKRLVGPEASLDSSE